MPINFPDSPSTGDTHTVGDKTWTYDGTAWNLVTSSGSDHGTLGGLQDDDHTQYLLADGTRTATEVTVSGDLTVDTNTLHVDSTNNRVGIGTTTPAEALDVFGTIHIGLPSDTYLLFEDTGTPSESFIRHSSADGSLMLSADQNASLADSGISMRVDGATRMRLDSSGNLGIGTTSPTGKLHISDSNPTIWLTDTDTNADSYVSASSSVGSLILSADENNEVGSSQIAFKVDGSDKMVVQSTGNVGIGTTNPVMPIDFNAPGSDGARMRFEDGTTQTSGIQFTANGSAVNYSTQPFIGKVDLSDSDPIGIWHSGAWRMVVNSSGNVGIGDTTPNTKLHISSGTSGDAELRIEADTDNNDENDLPSISLAADGGILEGVIALDNNALRIVNNVQTDGGISFCTGTTNVYTNATDVVSAAPERMRVHPSGYVTQSNQPSVFAFSPGTDQTAGGSTPTKVQFNNTQHNIGGHYSTSTDRFTCPVAGEYLVAWYGLGGATNAVYRYFLRINGAEWNNLHVRADGIYDGYTRTVILDLVANDYLEVWYNSDSNVAQYTGGGNAYYTFVVRLLG